MVALNPGVKGVQMQKLGGASKGLKSLGSLSSCQTGIWGDDDPVERNTVRPAWKAFLTQQAMQKGGSRPLF